MCWVHPIQIQEYANPPLLRLLSFVTLLCLVKKIRISMKPAAGKMDYKMFIFSDCNLWQLTPNFSNLWQCMATMETYCNLRRVVANYDKLWQGMASHGNLWQLIATHGIFWRLMALCGKLWQVLASYGKLRQLKATYGNAKSGHWRVGLGHMV